jgi:phosphocarrier protein FPr
MASTPAIHRRRNHQVSANVGTPEEVAPAVAQGADGVGLFRTEFLFMDRDAMPTEDEQEAAYRLAAETLPAARCCCGPSMPVRTCPPYLGQPPERSILARCGGAIGAGPTCSSRSSAPSSGWRPTSDSRDVPHGGRPTNSTARSNCWSEARQAVGPGTELETGIMVEVPAAALTAPALAPSVDFFSIGTNDLTQYVLAADRGNEHVAALSDALHPAVLRLIEATTIAARAHGRWVGVCGELASDATATSLLLGLGVRELSMSAPAIGRVKQVVRSTDIPEAEALAAKALACASAAEVRALLAG